MAGNEIKEIVSRDPEKKDSIKIIGDIDTDLISPLVEKIMKINKKAESIGGSVKKLKELAHLSTAKEQREIDDFLNNKVEELNSILNGDDVVTILKKLKNVNPSELSKVVLTMKPKQLPNKSLLKTMFGNSTYVEAGSNYLNRNRQALKYDK